MKYEVNAPDALMFHRLVLVIQCVKMSDLVEAAVKQEPLNYELCRFNQRVAFHLLKSSASRSVLSPGYCCFYVSIWKRDRDV